MFPSPAGPGPGAPGPRRSDGAAASREPGLGRAGDGEAALGESSDQVLLRRVLGREPGAADQFFDAHFRHLYEFAHYRMGGERSEVEDVVQDTFTVAFENLARFDGRSSVSSWLSGIAKNKIRARRRKHRPMALSDAIASADDEIDALLSSIDETELPQWVLERRETEELVGATLSQLSLDHREALIAKYVDGESTAAVAARRNTSPKAAESLLARARASFAGVFTLLAKRRGGYE
jgi:RNA polymerase sigma-70 factor (ECF subfamily)